MHKRGLLLALAAVLNLWAQAPGNRPRVSAEAVERGRVQFAQSCAFCHGPNATGGTHGPSLIRSSVARHDENGDLIGDVVRNGRPGQGMPAIPLNQGQITDIAVFLQSRISAADIRSANRPLRGFADKLITGNAEAGKAFFQGAGGCKACHSPEGDLKGIAGKYQAADLQARFLYPQQRRQKATVTDASGKQYTGDLMLLSNYDVAIQDAGGWYRSWPVADVKVDVKDPLTAHFALLKKYTNADMHNMLAYLVTLK